MRRVWALLVGVALFGVLGALAVQQVRLDDLSTWWWGFPALLFAVGAGFLMWRSERSDPRRGAAFRDAGGHAPWLSEVTDVQLGITPSDYAGVRVAREADEQIDDVLRSNCQVLVVTGPALSGGTRVLADVVRTRDSSGVRVVIPVEMGVGQWRVREAYECARWYASHRTERVVLWMEKITLQGWEALAAAAQDEPVPNRLTVMVTTHEPGLPTELTSVGRGLWETAAIVEVGALSIAEAQAVRAEPALAGVLPRLDEGERLLGTLVTAREPAKAVLRNLGRNDDQLAVLRAVIDWAQIGVPSPLTIELLEGLSPLYWRDLKHVRMGMRVPNGLVDRAVTTLLQPQGEAGWVWVRSVSQGLEPHPVLLQAVAAQDQKLRWGTPTRIWGHLAAVLPEQKAREFGTRLVHSGDVTHGVTLLDRIDVDTLPSVTLESIVAGYKDLDVGTASRWLIYATHRPDHAPGAWVNLGSLEAEQGRTREARAAFRAAIDSGHPEHAPGAWVNLGSLEAEQGRTREARAAFRAAIDTGHPEHAPDAWVGLGNLEAEQGRTREARAAFRAAIDTGHPEHAPGAWINLGSLEAEQGRTREARAAFRAAIDSGHPEITPDAWIGLGNLEEALGHPSGARTAWRHAIESGHPQAEQTARRLVAQMDENVRTRQRAQDDAKRGY